MVAAGDDWLYRKMYQKLILDMELLHPFTVCGINDFIFMRCSVIQCFIYCNQIFRYPLVSLQEHTP